MYFLIGNMKIYAYYHYYLDFLQGLSQKVLFKGCFCSSPIYRVANNSLISIILYVFNVDHLQYLQNAFTCAGVIMSSICEVYLKMGIWMRAKNNVAMNACIWIWSHSGIHFRFWARNQAVKSFLVAVLRVFSGEQFVSCCWNAVLVDNFPTSLAKKGFHIKISFNCKGH